MICLPGSELLSFDKAPPFPPEDYYIVKYEDLMEFVTSVFVKIGVPEEHARWTADNLVTADLRGIDSHGVARLKRYVDGILNNAVKVNPNIQVAREGPAFALIDGDSGLGQVVGRKAMELAIKKAKDVGVGLVTVRMSNHFGIAGYYAMMALDHDMIGVAMTNARPLVAHTGALGKWMGTNPIAVAAPTNSPPPWVLDMATSVAPIGKMEVYSRIGKEAPLGWGIDPQGNLTSDPNVIMGKGALLPLGGLGELLGGHKGYGLAALVELFSAVLSGAALFRDVGQTEGPGPSNVGHFFMAINVESFMPVDEFKKRMDYMIKTLKSAPLHPDFDRIWIHGEKSWYTTQKRLRDGIPIYKKVMTSMKDVADRVGVKFPWKL